MAYLPEEIGFDHADGVKNVLLFAGGHVLRGRQATETTALAELLSVLRRRHVNGGATHFQMGRVCGGKSNGNVHLAKEWTLGSHQLCSKVLGVAVDSARSHPPVSALEPIGRALKLQLQPHTPPRPAVIYPLYR